MAELRDRAALERARARADLLEALAARRHRSPDVHLYFRSGTSSISGRGCSRRSTASPRIQPPAARTSRSAALLGTLRPGGERELPLADRPGRRDGTAERARGTSREAGRRGDGGAGGRVERAGERRPDRGRLNHDPGSRPFRGACGRSRRIRLCSRPSPSWPPLGWRSRSMAVSAIFLISIRTSKRTSRRTDLRDRVRRADGLLISSPEYAHGVPGAMKNALDWLVGGEEFIYKPVALLNASPRATHAQASLAETIRTMSGRLVPEASIAVPSLPRQARRRRASRRTRRSRVRCATRSRRSRWAIARFPDEAYF